MEKKSVGLLVFLGCEMVVSLRILLFTIPVIIRDYLQPADAVVVKNPQVSLLTMLACLYLLAGFFTLRGRTTAKLLQVGAALITFVIALRLIALELKAGAGVNPVLALIALSTVIMAYYFISRFPCKCCCKS